MEKTEEDIWLEAGGRALDMGQPLFSFVNRTAMTPAGIEEIMEIVVNPTAHLVFTQRYGWKSFYLLFFLCANGNGTMDAEGYINVGLRVDEIEMLLKNPDGGWGRTTLDSHLKELRKLGCIRKMPQPRGDKGTFEQLPGYQVTPFVHNLAYRPPESGERTSARAPEPGVRISGPVNNSADGTGIRDPGFRNPEVRDSPSGLTRAGTVLHSSLACTPSLVDVNAHASAAGEVSAEDQERADLIAVLMSMDFNGAKRFVETESIELIRSGIEKCRKDPTIKNKGGFIRTHVKEEKARLAQPADPDGNGQQLDLGVRNQVPAGSPTIVMVNGVEHSYVTCPMCLGHPMELGDDGLAYDNRCAHCANLRKILAPVHPTEDDIGPVGGHETQADPHLPGLEAAGDPMAGNEMGRWSGSDLGPDGDGEDLGGPGGVVYPFRSP